MSPISVRASLPKRTAFVLCLAGTVALAIPAPHIAAEPPPPPAPVDTSELEPGRFEGEGDPPLVTSTYSERSPGCTFDGSNYWNGTSGNAGDPINRSAIVQRASSWVNRAGTEWCASRSFPNEYGTYPSANHGRYRVDCSGFVSMAWGLSQSYSTSTLPNISTRLGSIDELRPGDILLRPGHTLVFIRWADADTLVLAQESSEPNRASQFTKRRADLDSRYAGYRYNRVIEAPSAWSFTVSRDGRTSSTDLVIRPSGSRVRLEARATGATSVRFGSSPIIGSLPTKALVVDGRAILDVKVPANTTARPQVYEMRLRLSGPGGMVWSSRHPTVTVRVAP